eukprot:6151731-Prymnesium_polylepis.1
MLFSVRFLSLCALAGAQQIGHGREEVHLYMPSEPAQQPTRRRRKSSSLGVAFHPQQSQTLAHTLLSTCRAALP